MSHSTIYIVWKCKPWMFQAMVNRFFSRKRQPRQPNEHTFNKQTFSSTARPLRVFTHAYYADVKPRHAIEMAPRHVRVCVWSNIFRSAYGWLRCPCVSARFGASLDSRRPVIVRQEATRCCRLIAVEVSTVMRSGKKRVGSKRRRAFEYQVTEVMPIIIGFVLFVRFSTRLP